MHEDLLGYLLGALEPDETARIEAAIRKDPELRRQLDQVQRSLEPLAGGDLDAAEPPPIDLVSRTLDALPPLTAATRPSGDPARQTPQAVAGHGGSVGLSPSTDRVGSAFWRWQDWCVASISAAVVLALLLPAIWNGRFEARKIACQDNLRRLGTAITQFVTRSEQNRLPAVSPGGPEAFAGVYAVRLGEAGLLDDPTIRWCPSFELPVARRSSSFDDRPTEGIATIQDLYAASVDRLREFQRFAGGHYAYTLGVRDEGRFGSPRYEQRSGFAIMSDAPLGGFSVGGMLSPQRFPRPIAHDGRGLNVLYEDGHVRFITVGALIGLPDDPWLNHLGDAEAGITPDDAALAPSWRPPFMNSLQR